MVDPSAHLQLAEKLHRYQLTLSALPGVVETLPRLTRRQFERLATTSLTAAQHWPRRGWSIAAVADAAAQQSGDRRLAADGAWLLAQAANAYTRPTLVTEVTDRALSSFTALNLPGWVAATIWQRNAQPWTRNDFPQTATELNQALAGLQAQGLTGYVPHCRLSLAYALLLQARFDEAAEQVAAAQEQFEAAGDQANLARAWLAESSYLRRQHRLDAAHERLNGALAVFEKLALPIDAAKTRYQLAYTVWYRQDDSATAANHFRAARQIFRQRDLPLWIAQCETGLAQIANDQGQLMASGRHLRTARRILNHSGVYGLQADALLDSGHWQMLQGDYSGALSRFQQANELYSQLGVGYMTAVTDMYIGELFGYLNRFEDGLRRLETAHERLADLKITGRLAECEMRLAQLWLWLDRPERSHPYLDQATTHAIDFNRVFLPEIYSVRVEALFRENRLAEAIAFLEEQLAVTQQEEDWPQLATTTRLLGQALLASDRLAEARRHLIDARDRFTTMEMRREAAICDLLLGQNHAAAGHPAEAIGHWQSVLQRRTGTTPDLQWQAYAGLAGLAEAGGDTAGALRAYRQMVEALSQARRWFWQPGLAGSYWQRPSTALDKAVDLAARTGHGDDALQLIEAGKAQTLARLLEGNNPHSTGRDGERESSAELDQAAMHIRWLQQRIEESRRSNHGRLRPPAELKWRRELIGAVEQYDQLLGQWERRRATDQRADGGQLGFDLDRWRQQAATGLGDSWLALDYYLTDERLTCLVVTPTETWLETRPVPPNVAAALAWLSSRRPEEDWLRSDDFAALGRWLFSEAVTARLASERFLLIAPHRRLHRLPWASLLPGDRQQPLVALAIPVLIPSLTILSALWERPLPPEPPHRQGLLLAVSDFDGRHPALGEVKEEAALLASEMAPESQLLLEEAATWSNLLAQSGRNGLRRFAFWHVASHAFHEPNTGRLSGLALADQDIWLDQLWQCAPLPGLVTLSACSGSQSKVYAGDEPVGLTSTCLAARSQRVVGSLWPVRDRVAGQIMLSFYRHYFAGRRAPLALAEAQRAALAEGRPVTHWGAFICRGAP